MQHGCRRWQREEISGQSFVIKAQETQTFLLKVFLLLIVYFLWLAKFTLKSHPYIWSINYNHICNFTHFPARKVAPHQFPWLPSCSRLIETTHTQNRCWAEKGENGKPHFTVVFQRKVEMMELPDSKLRQTWASIVAPITWTVCPEQFIPTLVCNWG